MNDGTGHRAKTAIFLNRFVIGVVLALVPLGASADERRPFLPKLAISSTIPANGDLNPYGVAIVPPGFPSGGPLKPGDVLVSNFNNSSNLQGTGTTIINYTPNDLVAPAVPAGQAGNAATFFQGPPFPDLPGLGLTLALGVLQRGFVLVGAVPTTDGSHVQPPGALFSSIAMGPRFHPPHTQTSSNGPWGLTVDDQFDHARVFVANVLNGTVTRLNVMVGANALTVTSATVIASGYAFRTDPAAVVLGPTGLAFDASSDTLFVASTADDAIFAVPHAGTRTTSSGPEQVIFTDPHLRGPLALVFAPNGNLITSNGDAVNPLATDPSEIVEFTRSGQFVRQFNVDAAPDGAFGVAIASLHDGGSRLVVVDDNANDLTVLDRQSGSPGKD